MTPAATAPVPASTPRALLVTVWLPTESDWTRTAGMARRQGMLVDALKRTGLALDVLLYVSRKRFDGTEADRLRIERELTDYWQWPIDLRICVWRDAPADPTRWSHYGRPMLDYREQRYLRPFSGAAQINALSLALARQPRLVLFHRLGSMVPLLAGGLSAPPALLDLDDIEHIAFAQTARRAGLGGALERLQVPALVHAERKAVRAARHILVCSAIDRQRLRRVVRTDDVVIAPNAVSKRHGGPPSARPTLLMLGHYSFAPNRAGAEFMIESVWPLIRQRRPDAILRIAGASPELLRAHEQPPPGVEFTGYVDDLDALYADTRIVICPLLSGSGTRLKVLEAASYGRPVVATPIGAEGIELRDGEEILLAEGAASFAARCTELLEDPDRCARMGRAAQQRIEQDYGREAVVDRIAGLLNGLVAQ